MCVEEFDMSQDGWYWSENEHGWVLSVNAVIVIFVAAEAWDVEDTGMRAVIENHIPKTLRPDIVWRARIDQPMVADAHQPFWPIVKRKPSILDNLYSS